MTIQETRDFFANSDFSEASKQKIAELLEGKDGIDFGMTEQIRSIMQEELDVDFIEAGITDADVPDAAALKADYDAELAQIESELDGDMQFVEGELAELDAMRKDVMKISDEMEADDIRKTL